MQTIIDRSIAPSYLLEIPELDFSDILFAEPITRPWFKLGAWSIPNKIKKLKNEEVFLQTILIDPSSFVKLYDNLESIGNVLHNLGKPEGWVFHEGNTKHYKYMPFYLFEFPFNSIVGEPLVFTFSDSTKVELSINPDLWMYFGLEERIVGSGTWRDPRSGLDVLMHYKINNETLEIIEIRTDYLLRYLRARQKSLLIGHYRGLYLSNPSETVLGKFVNEDILLGSPENSAKALLQNWGPRQDILEGGSFLFRRLHLWYEIKPPEIDVDDPWTTQPSFDPYTFTFPTSHGPVAPARWSRFKKDEGYKFEGECDFLDRIYFRQEVLTKYEQSSEFEVRDDGSIICHHYWSIHDIFRIGNELLSISIGHFAESIRFEEWSHWRQYAVEPLDAETLRVIAQEKTISSAVNSVTEALNTLNISFTNFHFWLFGNNNADILWNGSLDSLAGRQLKWVYPITANDDEFLKRATLTSTLVLEGLGATSLRKLLGMVAVDLQMSNDNPPSQLGSRNLLQRLTLISALIEDFHPDIKEIPMLVKYSESVSKLEEQPDLNFELQQLYLKVRDELAPMAFLYDLRNYAGLSHKPNKSKTSETAVRLGLPENNWRRADFLHLLELITESIYKINNHLQNAAIEK